VQRRQPSRAAAIEIRRVAAVAPETTAFVGLGANLGELETALRKALAGIGALPGTRVLRVSSLYRSAPFEAGGPDYLNAVAETATSLGPLALLQHLQALERAAGRERPYRNAPRTLDLDILLYGDLRLDTAALTVPHPRMHERAFVLLPLAELAPQRVLPQWLADAAGQAIERCGELGWAKDSD
jgi:2-amino-4-hydroxy-6-hydroxymethyldihydropteridine diphosphokinase